jgi:hypothetical protein
MAASRLISPALRWTPFAALALLETWAAWDLLAVPDRRWITALALPFLANLALLLLSRGSHRQWARWSGLLALGATYVVSHAFVLGIQVLPALVFVSLLIAQVELRILSERFAPLFLTTITAAQQRQIELALARALVRLTIASILAVVIPLLAADLATAGVVPVTTIPTALLLSAALVAVVLILALLPSLESKIESGQRGVLGTADSLSSGGLRIERKG